jgi:hypothetical protein
MDMSWEEIAEVLCAFIKVPTKELTEMYNLWEFKAVGGEIHRCKDDCIALHGLVLDYDQNLSMVDAVNQFAGFECVIYTTFNHGTDSKDKFRVVLPFGTPMPIDSFDKKRKAMLDAFPGVDRASFSRSQAIFLHSGPSADKAFAARMGGVMLDWTVFEDEIVVPYTPVVSNFTPDDEFQTAYRESIIESLSTCSGFRHLTSLSLAIILKSCGASFADYCAIVQACGAKDSCIQDRATQQETWAAARDDVRIGREKRDRFITEHGGKLPVSKYNKNVNQVYDKLAQSAGLSDIAERIKKLRKIANGY